MPIHSKVIAEEDASADGQTARSFQSSSKSSVKDEADQEDQQKTMSPKVEETSPTPTTY